MKKIASISVSLVLALGVLAVPAWANMAEKARVIRIDKENKDTLVERLDGSLWMLQHNPLCSSMTTEFPVNLMIDQGKVTDLKVAQNEICKVYNAFAFGGDALMESRIKVISELQKEHEAKIVWDGFRYQVDYGTGCSNLRGLVGSKIYVSLKDGGLAGGQLVLPNNLGKCSIVSAKKLEAIEQAAANAPAKLSGLESEARNNEAYFYWDASEGDPLYLISYSRYKLNTSYYPWKSMPNVKTSKDHQYLLKNLANGRLYYVYLAALSKEGVPGEWTEVRITPKGSGGMKNNPDPEPFEVKMTEKGENYVLDWPAKDGARRWRVTFSVAGRTVLNKLVQGTVTEYQIPKKAEYIGKGLRVTVKSLPKKFADPTFSDGIYWEVKAPAK